MPASRWKNMLAHVKFTESFFPAFIILFKLQTSFAEWNCCASVGKEGESINWLLHYRVITLFDKFYLLVQRTFLMNFNVLNELLWISKAQIISRFSRFSNLIPNVNRFEQTHFSLRVLNNCFLFFFLPISSKKKKKTTIPRLQFLQFNQCMPSPTVLFNRLIILKSHSPILNKSYVNSHRVHRGASNKGERSEANKRRKRWISMQSRNRWKSTTQPFPCRRRWKMKTYEYNNGIHKAAITKRTPPLCVFYGGSGQ